MRILNGKVTVRSLQALAPWLVCGMLALALAACTDEAADLSIGLVPCPDGAERVDGACAFEQTLEIAPATLGPARVGRGFAVTLVASGGVAPYSFAATGALPPGLELDSSGAFSGAPAELGTFDITVVATDSRGAVGQRTWAFEVIEEGDACTPSDEICDGIDNDCDGETDEGCTCEPSEEVCDGQDNDCDGVVDNGVLNACGECGDVPDEICDGQDNDCDGETDEGCPCEPGAVEACGLSEGACEPGERRCEDGAWGACDGAVGPAEETCDGVDNDCDGETDEGVLNACGACGDVPEEVCDGEDNDCDGQIDEDLDDCVCEPSEEVCDGQDNDCDGVVDNGVLNACGECGDVPEETCDGVDNDCDGEVDEGFDLPCECEPSEEVCDGLDNDCDGEIDEEAVDAPSWWQDNDGDGIGLSGTRIEACEQPEGFVDVRFDCNDGNPNVYPDAPEECDGLDNDCDGETDEGFDLPCDCEPSEEVCDGVDNDCDGEIDEDAVDAPSWWQDNDGDGIGLSGTRIEACEQPEGFVDVRFDCNDGNPNIYPGAPELCDGVDSDCDGEPDNDTVGTGDACGGGPGVCAPGQTACRDGRLVCEGIDNGDPEVCDGIDNDCDGEIDEEAAEVGNPCEVAGCATGSLACVDGELICDAAGGTGVEPGTIESIVVSPPFVRAYTGTAAEYTVQNTSSFSVLLASDGEFIYNVAFGIDGQPWTGWTVQVYALDGDRLNRVDRYTIPANWEDEGAALVGFAGVAAKDGVIWALNFNSDQFGGDGVWQIDLEAQTAGLTSFWGPQRFTYEASAEYDAANDLFWTVQLNATNPFVFTYPGSGIDPNAELGRAQLFPSDPQTVPGPQGAIAAGPNHIFTALYSNARQPAEEPLWAYDNGLTTGQTGANPRILTSVRPGASMTYHDDGFIYIPNQNNLNRVRRVAAVIDSSGQEVCDDLDNDCDGLIDEDGVCDSADMVLVQLSAFPAAGDNARLELVYTVSNSSDTVTQPIVDRVVLTPIDGTPGQEFVLADINRSAFAPFETRTFQEGFTLPDNIAAGRYEVRVTTDFLDSTGDLNRANNTRATEVSLDGTTVCAPDVNEPNDSADEATPLPQFSYTDELTLCEGEEDWFEVEVNGLEVQGVGIQFFTSGANLDLYVYDENGDEVANSTGTSNTEYIRFRNIALRRRPFSIRVVANGGTPNVEYAIGTEGL